MRRSKLFIKTRKNAPSDETAKNAQLLIQAGYIHKELAGVYSYLPMGMAVIENIKKIVRDEMDSIGGQEMILSALQHPHIWKTTDRWDEDKVDIWFKTILGEETELGLAWSHEEPMARIMTQFINSYKDLPAYPYQFQTKFRKELRAKSGLMRGREFIMKDLYSFSRGREDHDKFYELVAKSYMKVYKRLGIGDITYKTFASGGPFSKFSHEFQTLSPVGEDTIYFHQGEGIAINKEVLNDGVLSELGISRQGLVEKTTVEVGNIFTFGSRYSEPLGLFFTDEKGIQQPVFMGSYGIGISRLMGLLAEHFADNKGLIWPAEVAPYQVYLARLGSQPEVTSFADQVYNEISGSGISVLYDDRDERPGEMFADADLMGIPKRLVVSRKTVSSNSVEIKDRSKEAADLVPADKVIEAIASLKDNLI